MCSNGEGPSARRGASLTPSEDGESLWVVGGNAGRGSLMDAYSYHLESGLWARVIHHELSSRKKGQQPYIGRRILSGPLMRQA